jgi:CBS domain-containing protein
MKREKVRRLPVVDENGILEGIVAMNDFVLAAAETKGGKAPGLSYEDVVRAMKTVSAHRVLVGT